MIRVLKILGILTLLYSIPTRLSAQALRLAVAANFRPVMKDLASRYHQWQTRNSGDKVKPLTKLLLSYGSTGKLYAQIHMGAPFDIFLAADMVRPKKLRAALGLNSEVIAYCKGSLALVSTSLSEGEVETLSRKTSIWHSLSETLAKPNLKVSMANPKFAPYGKAARLFLNRIIPKGAAFPQLILGENVSQAYQFFKAGSASLALVAHSQAIDSGLGYVVIPGDSKASLLQGLLVIRPGKVTRDFVSFLLHEETQNFLGQSGYEPIKARANG